MVHYHIVHREEKHVEDLKSWLRVVVHAVAIYGFDSLLGPEGSLRSVTQLHQGEDVVAHEEDKQVFEGDQAVAHQEHYQAQPNLKVSRAIREDYSAQKEERLHLEAAVAFFFAVGIKTLLQVVYVGVLLVCDLVFEPELEGKQEDGDEGSYDPHPS